jgi:hypothetical protein
MFSLSWVLDYFSQETINQQRTFSLAVEDFRGG